MAAPNTTTLGNMGRAVVTSPHSGAIDLPKIFDFEFRRIETKLKREFITGERDKFSFPDGWSGKFSFDRTNPDIEDAFVFNDGFMDNFGSYQNWDVTFSIFDPTGKGRQVLTFHGCAMTLSEGGNYKQNAVVTQTITFEAATLNYIVIGQ
jgi:hypothetical protein